MHFLFRRSKTRRCFVAVACQHCFWTCH